MLQTAAGMTSSESLWHCCCQHADTTRTPPTYIYCHAQQETRWAHLIESKFSLEMDQQPAVAEEKVEAVLACKEGMQLRINQSHQLFQCLHVY